MSVKKLQHNRGFTLVELVVSIAIMAIIMVAVSGIMFSNNIIVRKTKSDIYVQNNAQDVYNKLNEDIMQAKHIYVKGYTCANDISFVPSSIGASTAETVTEVAYLLDTDKYVLTKKTGSTKDFLSGNFQRDTSSRDDMLNAMSAADKAFYTDLLNTPADQINNKLENNCTQAQRDTYVSLVYYTDSEVSQQREAMSADDRKAFDSYWNRFKYMNADEIDESAAFLDSIPSPSSTHSFSELSTFVPATGKKSYTNLYITQITLVYTQDVDLSNCTASDKTRFNTDKTTYSSGIKEVESGGIKTVVSDTLDYTPKDIVTVTYTFGEAGDENKIKVDYKYKYMTKLNTSNFSGVDNNVVTNKLNYAVAGTSTVVPGCLAQIDAENDSIKLLMFFAENSMSYKDVGMVKLRNSNVLHDAK